MFVAVSEAKISSSVLVFVSPVLIPVACAGGLLLVSCDSWYLTSLSSVGGGCPVASSL